MALGSIELLNRLLNWYVASVALDTMLFNKSIYVAL